MTDEPMSADEESAANLYAALVVGGSFRLIARTADVIRRKLQDDGVEDVIRFVPLVVTMTEGRHAGEELELGIFISSRASAEAIMTFLDEGTARRPPAPSSN